MFLFYVRLLMFQSRCLVHQHRVDWRFSRINSIGVGVSWNWRQWVRKVVLFDSVSDDQARVGFT